MKKAIEIENKENKLKEYELEVRERELFEALRENEREEQELELRKYEIKK